MAFPMKSAGPVAPPKKKKKSSLAGLEAAMPKAPANFGKTGNTMNGGM